jgi:tRNA(Ile)-lysidine synthase
MPSSSSRLPSYDEVARREGNTIYLDKKQMTGLSVALQRHLLRAAVTELVGDVRDIEAGHIEAARSLVNKPAGKISPLPHGFICQAGYDELMIAGPLSVIASGLPACSPYDFGRRARVWQAGARQSELPPCPFPPLPHEYHLKVPGKTAFSGWNVLATIVREQTGLPPSRRAMTTSRKVRRSNFVAHLDLQKTGMNLCVRKRRPGDRFQPLGMSMDKKLHEFMVDAKIPRSWRGRIPIVCSPQQIIWVAGWRIDDRAKLTEASKEILRLEFIRSK